jgi:hypothetical protein
MSAKSESPDNFMPGKWFQLTPGGRTHHAAMHTLAVLVTKERLSDPDKIAFKQLLGGNSPVANGSVLTYPKVFLSKPPMERRLFMFCPVPKNAPPHCNEYTVFIPPATDAVEMDDAEILEARKNVGELAQIFWPERPVSAPETTVAPVEP